MIVSFLPRVLKTIASKTRTARWWVATCVILACAAGPQAVEARAATSMKAHPVIVSEFSPVDIVPDGVLGKFWATAKHVHFNEAGYSRKMYPKAETTVASRWTAKYLYLAFWCHYQKLNVYEGEDPKPERWGLWDRDVVETFLNPRPEDPSHYYEFEVAPTNQWIDLEIHLHRHPFNDAKWNSGFQHATRIDAAHHIWTAEMRIPVAAMKVDAIRPGVEWRLNFYRDDGPGNGYARREMSWGPLPLNLKSTIFHQPASFGTIRFAGPGH